MHNAMIRCFIPILTKRIDQSSPPKQSKVTLLFMDPQKKIIILLLLIHWKKKKEKENIAPICKTINVLFLQNKKILFVCLIQFEICINNVQF